MYCLSRDIRDNPGHGTNVTGWGIWSTPATMTAYLLLLLCPRALPVVGDRWYHYSDSIVGWVWARPAKLQLRCDQGGRRGPGRSPCDGVAGLQGNKETQKFVGVIQWQMPEENPRYPLPGVDAILLQYSPAAHSNSLQVFLVATWLCIFGVNTGLSSHARLYHRRQR